MLFLVCCSLFPLRGSSCLFTCVCRSLLLVSGLLIMCCSFSSLCFCTLHLVLPHRPVWFHECTNRGGGRGHTFFPFSGVSKRHGTIARAPEQQCPRGRHRQGNPTFLDVSHETQPALSPFPRDHRAEHSSSGRPHSCRSPQPGRRAVSLSLFPTNPSRTLPLPPPIPLAPHRLLSPPPPRQCGRDVVGATSWGRGEVVNGGAKEEVRRKGDRERMRMKRHWTREGGASPSKSEMPL